MAPREGAEGAGRAAPGAGREGGGDAGGQRCRRAAAQRRPPGPCSGLSGADAPPGGAGRGRWEGHRYSPSRAAPLRPGAPAHLRAGEGFLNCRGGRQPFGCCPLWRSFCPRRSPRIVTHGEGCRSPCDSEGIDGHWGSPRGRGSCVAGY